MKKLLLPLILALLGLGAGAAAGHFLKPAAEEEEPAAADEAAKEEESLAALSPPPAPPIDPAAATEYVKLDRQFIVPVVEKEKVGSLMVVSMAIETQPGGSELVFKHEPKLRDEFLRVMFLHAQSGGFSGAFTDPNVMDDLRAALTASARSILGDAVKSVLLTNIIRQDN